MPAVKLIVFPPVVQVKLLNVVEPDIVDAPVVSNVTVPEFAVNVPELAQLPATVNEAVDDALREPLEVIVTFTASMMRSLVSLFRVVILVSVALPMVRVPFTMIWPVAVEAVVTVRSPAEEFSKFRLLNVQLVEPDVAPKDLAEAILWVNVLLEKLMIPAVPATVPDTWTSAEPFELSTVPAVMVRSPST